MMGGGSSLILLTLYHGHRSGGGMSDWITHMVMSSVIHAVIYGFIFRFMHQLSLTQDALLVALVLGCMFMWSRGRDRRGW